MAGVGVFVCSCDDELSRRVDVGKLARSNIAGAGKIGFDNLGTVSVQRIQQMGPEVVVTQEEHAAVKNLDSRTHELPQ